MEGIILEPEQQELLMNMVEAVRNVPREDRQKFLLIRALGGKDTLHHPGFPNRNLEIYHGDLEILAECGLLTVAYGGRNSKNYDVHPRGFRYYEHMQRRSGEPIDQVEQQVHHYIEAQAFRDRHPVAYQEWHDAASQLWGPEPEKQLTSTGHECREALQEFAEDLVNQFKPEGASPHKKDTIDRVRGVLDQCKSRLGETEAPFLDALLAYWGTVSDLVQRQVHGGEREGEPLIWEDARRVVFQTAIVMYEIDRALHR